MNQCDEKHRSPTRNTPQPRAFRGTDAKELPIHDKKPAQWHGRFSTEPLAAAEFVALLNVGCTDTQAAATRDDSGAWAVQVGGKIVKIAADGDISVR